LSWSFSTGAVTPRDTIDLLVLAALWGGSFLFMRMGVHELGPVPLIELRVGIAALFLLPILWLQGGIRELRAHAKPIFMPLAAWWWPAQPISLTTWLAVAALGTACTGLGYILFFRLIANVGPLRAIAVTFLIPLFGMLLGALFLGESVSAAMLAGCTVILLGTSLATGLAKPETFLRWGSAKT
jgi:drug/metabolite transporter (DMT)-like permease